MVICSLLLVSSNVTLMAVSYSEAKFPYATTTFALSNYISNIGTIYILCIFVASMIFGNEHGNHTMKNSVSYGISRGSIYFGKLIVEMIYGIAAIVIITGIYAGSAYLMLKHSNANEFMLLIKACFAGLPLLLFALAAANCFLFMMEGSGAAIGAATGLLLAFPIVCSTLGMKFEFFAQLYKLMPLTMANNIGIDRKTNNLLLLWPGNTGYNNYWLYGILELVIITLIGFIVFRKREIK
jgi:hypothetical protein